MRAIEIQIATGRMEGNRLIPDLDPSGALRVTGYFSNRPDLLVLLRAIGVPDEVLTANELLVNPVLNARVRERLSSGEASVRVSAREALASGEF